jgi:hypothetical protein
VVDPLASGATDVDVVAVVADGMVTSVVVVLELEDDPPSEHAAKPMTAAARRTKERLGPTMARQ